MGAKRNKIRKLCRENSSADPKQLASCDGKARYATRREAVDRATNIAGVRAYKCGYCSFYHIGRAPK